MIPITYHIGDATQPVGDGPKIIVHICNDIGRWGAGFTGALSKRWKEPERNYRGMKFPARLGGHEGVCVERDIVVVNLIGQHDIQAIGGIPPIRYEAVREGLSCVSAIAKGFDYSIHMPRIGCNYAGGRWAIIEQIIIDELCSRDIPVHVYTLESEQGREW